MYPWLRLTIDPEPFHFPKLSLPVKLISVRKSFSSAIVAVAEMGLL